MTDLRTLVLAPPPVRAAQSTARLCYAVTTADPGFLHSLDRAGERVGLDVGLSRTREQIIEAMPAVMSWAQGVAIGRQMTTRESARGVRAHAHRAGLPVVGGGR